MRAEVEEKDPDQFASEAITISGYVEGCGTTRVFTQTFLTVKNKLENLINLIRFTKTILCCVIVVRVIQSLPRVFPRIKLMETRHVFFFIEQHWFYWFLYMSYYRFIGSSVQGFWRESS